MSHFSCIGVPVATAEEFEERVVALLSDAKEVGRSGSVVHLEWHDVSGAGIAFHLDDGAIACVTPFFRPADHTVWRVLTRDVEDAECPHCGGTDCDVLDEGGETLTRTTVQLVYYQAARGGLGGPANLQLAAFAHVIATFPDEAASMAGEWAQLADDEPPILAVQSFIPRGLLEAESEVGARAIATFAGPITAATRRRNASGGEFWHLVVDTYPRPVDVVVAPDSLDADPVVGQYARVHGWFVGSPV